MADRIATFSGSNWLHEHTHLQAGSLRSRLTQQCDAVAAHLKVSEGLDMLCYAYACFQTSSNVNSHANGCIGFFPNIYTSVAVLTSCPITFTPVEILHPSSLAFTLCRR